MMISEEIQAVIDHLPHSSTLVNEAAFGYRYVRPYLEKLGPDSSVLEVGSGPGILLAQIKRDYPHLEAAGAEPIGPGFAKFRPALESLRAEYGFELHATGYEELPTTRDCDLIFLVNVFEHLPDWRHFLRFMQTRLVPGGTGLILCPNYGFPYESHFALPIVLNKSLTRRLFRSSIERHERENDAAGLWESLNFVKWSQVKKFSAENGIRTQMNPRILRDLVNRLDQDPDFAARQRLIAGAARVALRMGLVRLLETRPMRRFLPYMLFEVSADAEA